MKETKLMTLREKISLNPNNSTFISKVKKSSTKVDSNGKIVFWNANGDNWPDSREKA